MAMVLQPSRLRLTQAVYFGKPPTPPGAGTVTQINAGSGITLVPSPIVGVGSVAVTPGTFVRADGTTPLTGTWNAGNFRINSQNSLPVFNVLAYGAVATGAGDQTAAIQAAITAAAAAGGGIVQFNEGTYRYLTGLTVLASRVYLRGAGVGATTLFFASATGNAIEFNGVSGVGVSDVTIVCFEDVGNTRTAGSAVYVLNSGDVKVSNLIILSGWDAIVLNGASSGYYENISISQLFANQSNNGVTLTNVSIGNRFTSVSVIANNIGWLFETGTDTAVLYDCLAQQTPTVATQVAFKIQNTGGSHDPRWLFFDSCFAETDYTNGIGWYFVKGYGIELNKCMTTWGKFGLVFNSSSVHDVRVIGGIIQLAGQFGIVGTGATDCLIDGTTISNNGISGANTYDGIYLADGSKNWRISNCRIGNSLWGAAPPAPAPGAKTQRYGINLVSGGNSTDIVISANDLTDNLSAPIFYGAVLASTITVIGNTNLESFVQKSMGVGTLLPTRAFDLNGTQRWRGIAAPAVSEANSATVYFDTATNHAKISENGGAYVNILGSGGVTGVGVANKIAFWSAPTTLTDEPNISLGGFATFDVNGTINWKANTDLLCGNLAVLHADTNGATSLGLSAGSNLAINNTAIGGAALTLATGINNTAVGDASCTSVTTGQSNASVGDASLFATTTGDRNTAVGSQAGLTNDTGSNNVFVGAQADANAGNYTNAVAIGYQAQVAASDSMVLGNGSMNVGIRTSTPKLCLDVNGAIGTRHHDVALVNGLNSDVVPTLTSWIRVTGPTAPFSIGGITSGEDGRLLFIRNTVAFQMTINHMDAGSGATNQIVTPTAAPINCSVATLIYEDATDLWYVMSYF